MTPKITTPSAALDGGADENSDNNDNDLTTTKKNRFSFVGSCVSPFCRDPSCYDTDNANFVGGGVHLLPPPPPPFPDLLYCGVIGGGGDTSGSDNSDDGMSRSIDSSSTTTTAAAAAYVVHNYNGSGIESSSSNNNAVFFRRRRPQGRQLQYRERKSDATTAASSSSSSSWKENLLKVSNIGSAICVLDCTLLPLLTILLPIVSALASGGGGAAAAATATASTTELWLHDVGHAVALWFVLPVGTLATASGYFFSHRRAWIGALGVVGLVLIAAANGGGTACGHALLSHHHHHHHHHHAAATIGGVAGILQSVLPSAAYGFVGRVLHLVQHGTAHRIANLAGCALLTGSNYLSKKFGNSPSCSDPSCFC